ncbi:LexA family transcriptional regulator [Acaryochloris sp. CCMEE 5410]|uniref:LexA family protein n=1 Tax=Acaryochloris sp. CCMEE 5410 TaxID=310037 RepID=UPI0002484EB7|nr:translesion error-prone DNA polymerase V autoproteolytic subunit [Acaryochloris sp. CCMEE 5410]KAI9129166.1 translesion error-prone DNA polymerase V autoproteolytic subunit [Acaryochloris sp. CCMEE 5410]
MLICSVHPVAWADSLCLPFLSAPVSAGFPSPADDHLQKNLNLQDALIPRPAATFLMRVEGDSMEGCGIFSGDLLVVDRSIDPVDGAVVIAVLDGEFTVKRFRKTQGKILLTAENPDYPPITVQRGMDFSVWGVVTYVVHGLEA